MFPCQLTNAVENVFQPIANHIMTCSCIMCFGINFQLHRCGCIWFQNIYFIDALRYKISRFYAMFSLLEHPFICHILKLRDLATQSVKLSLSFAGVTYRKLLLYFSLISKALSSTESDIFILKRRESFGGFIITYWILVILLKIMVTW